MLIVAEQSASAKYYLNLYDLDDGLTTSQSLYTYPVGTEVEAVKIFIKSKRN